MKLFDVYPLWDIEPVKAEGCRLWDKEGREYLDLYGGHAVISIGHSHPVYRQMLSDQIDKMGFYSNAVKNSLQTELALRLGDMSGYPEYFRRGSQRKRHEISFIPYRTEKNTGSGKSLSRQDFGRGRSYGQSGHPISIQRKSQCGFCPDK